MAYNNPITINFTVPRTPAEFFSAHGGHERYHLRSIALVASFLAIPLNIITAICSNANSITTIHSVALIPLFIAIAWIHIDLSSPPVYFRSGIPPFALFLVDTIGFLGFLALVIANGIAIGDLSYTRGAMFFSYASVPWLIICTVQLLLVGDMLLKHSGLHASGCNCGHDHSGARAGKERAEYTPLNSEQDDEEADVGGGT